MLVFFGIHFLSRKKICMLTRGQILGHATASYLPTGKHFLFDHVIRRGPQGGIRNSSGNIPHVTRTLSHMASAACLGWGGKEGREGRGGEGGQNKDRIRIVTHMRRLDSPLG